MTDNNQNKTDLPPVVSAKQAAQYLGIKDYSFGLLVKRNIIKPVPGFRSRRKYSLSKLQDYAAGIL